MSNLKVGIVGAGAIAGHHARAINEIDGLELIGATRRNQTECEKFVEQFGGRAFKDYREMLEQGVDILAIALPHHLHHPVALEAIAAGCHVMLEKPLCLNVPECLEVVEAGRRAGVKIVTADLAYWNASVRKAREIIFSGELGKFIMGSIINYRRYFTSERPAWFLDPAASGGGMLFNLGVHRMAVVRSIVPEEEIAITATVGYHEPGQKVEGSGVILLQYTSGAGVMLEECGYFEPPPKLNRGTHFTFENGIIGDVEDKMWIADREGNVTYPKLQSEPCGGSYGPLYRELLSAIEEEREPWPSAWQGMLDVRAICAAYESASDSKRVDLTMGEWVVEI